MSDDDEMTAEEAMQRVLALDHAETFEVVGVPQIRSSLEFIQARHDGRGFHAIETEVTEISEFDEPYKCVWAFIIDPDRGNSGVVEAHSSKAGAVPADATAESVTPQELEFSMTAEFYPKAFRGL